MSSGMKKSWDSWINESGPDWSFQRGVDEYMDNDLANLDGYWDFKSNGIEVDCKHL